jgi:hypothetical protein
MTRDLSAIVHHVETTLRAAAPFYTGLGLAIFPCVPRRKEPLPRHGHLDATTDIDMIKRWWRWWPDANPAIACRPSELVVVDVDPRNGGNDTLADLERQHGPLPATWRALTGGGGLHVVFQAPADVALVDGTVPPGIDIKANGYFVVPPAVHMSGRRYTWEVGYEPGTLPLAPLPTWLLTHRRDNGHDRPPVSGRSLVIWAGERNVELFRLACRWRRDGIGEAALLEMLRAVNKHHVQSPLGPLELQRIAASASRYAPGRRAEAKV